MNNLKKVSLSALAGSLAMVSAQAGDFTVTGGAEMTYLSNSENQGSTGNPFGMSHNIDFTGSGEVNGIGWTVFTGTTGQSLAGDSSSLVFDLGDMGTVSFDHGVGINGIGTLANNTPTAYEEADHNTAVLGDGLDATGDTGTIGYATTLAGLGIDVEYNPSTANAVKATAGTATGASTGSNLNYALTYEVMPGLTAGFGASKTSYTAATANDDEEWTASVNYAIDRFKMGYQASEINTAGNLTGRVQAYSVAMNVNENLSVSYGISNHEKTNVGTHVTEDNTGIMAAYTMGSAAFRIAGNSTDDAGAVVGDNRESIELSLNLSF